MRGHIGRQCGESTLVDDLLAQGYRNITVRDIPETAFEVAQKRLGPLRSLA